LKYETKNRFQLTTTPHTLFPDFLFHSTLAARDGQKRKAFSFCSFSSSRGAPGSKAAADG